MIRQIRIRNLCAAAVASVFMLAFAVSASSATYESLAGLKSVKAIFDVRAAGAKSAALHLKLIHDTYQDKNIRAVSKKPSFVVAFMGPSVKLISTNRQAFPTEDQKSLDEIAQTIREMAKEGIRIQVCDFAVKANGIDPASILPEIKHVPNSWISLIGYQAKGYSIVPVY
jgi:intracellular sulfur oxidation DsrE/DsrF family protein